ncbi:MAG: hypothetical protein ACRCSU_02425 [Paracoccaceae bacterium]
MFVKYRANSRIAAALCLAALTVAWPAAADTEPSAACAAFTPDADYVTNTIIMPLEGRRIELTVPSQYYEDYWDAKGGYEDTAQLFRVDMDDFTPVSRPETAVRLRDGRVNYMNFIVRDTIPLPEIALQATDTIGRSIPDPPVLPPGEPGPAGLLWIESKYSSKSDYPQKDLYVSLSAGGEVEVVLECNSPLDPVSKNPLCEHMFRAAGLDASVTYPRIFIDRWASIQADVTAFLTCATSHTLQ